MREVSREQTMPIHWTRSTTFSANWIDAALLGRSIAVILRTDIPVPERTLEMMVLLKRTLTDVQWYEVSSLQRAEALAIKLIDRAAAGETEPLRTNPRQYGRLLQSWWRWREPAPATQPMYWLEERFPAPPRAPNATVVAEALRLAEELPSERLRLSRVWIAAKELMGAPYWEPSGLDWLPQWKGVLGAWGTSAAWYGLHGHLELGYLSALHSLNKVCEIALRNDPLKRADPSWAPPVGSLASAYYALARRVPSRKQRNAGMLRALTLVDQGVAYDPISESNLLAIRGSILRERHEYGSAVEAYRKVLRLREAAGASGGAIGEAKTELGFGLLFTWRVREGYALLKEGVALMEKANYRTGFIVRAKRKLALASFLSGHIGDAITARKEARLLAERDAIGRVVQ